MQLPVTLGADGRTAVLALLLGLLLHLRCAPKGRGRYKLRGAPLEGEQAFFRLMTWSKSGCHGGAGRCAQPRSQRRRYKGWEPLDAKLIEGPVVIRAMAAPTTADGRVSAPSLPRAQRDD